MFDAVTRLALQLLGGKIRGGPAKGLRFHGGDTAGYLLGASEPAVQEAMVRHLHPGDVFYDIGANIGFHAVLASRLVGRSGEVHCFEPLEQNVVQLRRNLELNGFAVHVHQLALSDTTGVSGMAAEGPLGRARLGEGELMVKTARLDELGLPEPKLIKMDVEGAESLVLQGMRKLLTQKPLLLIEIHPGQEEPVREILNEYDYTISSLDNGGMPHLLAQ